MNNKQQELLKQLFNVLCDISLECEHDEEFNINLSQVIQDKNITGYSVDDLANVISNYINN